MKNRRLAGLMAGLLSMTTAVQAPAGTFSAADTDSYDIKVSIDLTGEKKTISPYIYGVNEFGDGANVKNVTVNAVRQGGNRYTGYNWETNWSNAGEDWHNSSDTNIGDITEGPASAAQKLSKQCVKHNIPYKITTLQMAGYVSADKDGTVKEDEVAPSKRWLEVKPAKGAAFDEEPDLTDGVVYMDEYVNYIVNKLGDSTTETGMNGYSLDNEPVLWNDTHPLMHPEEITNAELISKSIALAKAVKAVDPKAEIFGPAFWGMLPCMNGSDTENYSDPDWAKVKGNYFWYLDYYLEQMKAAEKEAGMRLLDVVDVHYYSQDCATDEARLQGARSLYDPTYVENSWLQPWAGKYFPFLTNLKKSVDTYYPGTKIAISEYNIANISDEKNTGKSAVSALAEAEALGAFALNEVYFATYWGTLKECPYVEGAINLYTNYDGKGSAFGDTLVSTTSEDLSKAAAFAAINGDDTSKVTLVLSNKDMEKTQKATIDIKGAAKDYKSLVVYAVEQEHSDVRVIRVDNALDGKITVELPPVSVAQIVLSDKESDEKLYEAPEITEKTETFNFDDLEESKNGYPMIPLGDVKHLTKAVIDLECSCSSGAGWYCGGGGLTFNKLSSEDAAAFWGFKSFGYAAGDKKSTVVFDGLFSDGKTDDIKAEIKDDYIEFQDWWKSSANEEDGSDVSVTYKSITLYYEYDGKEPVVEPTTVPAQPTSSTPAEPTIDDSDVLLGDANCDEIVSIADATAILQAIGNKDEYDLSPQGRANADVVDRGNGLTGLDALAIQMVDAKVLSKSALPIKSADMPQ